MNKLGVNKSLDDDTNFEGMYMISYRVSHIEMS